MKILILSVTAGEGHNSTAAAVRHCFAKRGITCDTVDTLKYINSVLGKTVDRGYIASTKNLQAPYAKVYRMMEKRKTVRDEYSLTRLTNSIVAKKMYRLIKSYSPDAIIVTHCFAAVLLDVVKEKYGLDMPLYGIVTDFTIHPFWEEATGFDYIVTANELLSLQVAKKGFSSKQILPLGIPIKSKFAVQNDKQEMRLKHGLDPNKHTVLIMSGSMGFGKIEDTVKALDELKSDFQLIIVCGRNEKSKAAIESTPHKKKILCLGYVDYVDELMDCSDCFVSKPGGLTTSEALAKELPIIIVNPIPGVEDRNADFLTNNGIAMRVSETCPIDEIIYQYFRFPEKIENMKKSISLIKRPDSSESLCKHVIAKVNERKSRNK